MENFLNTVFVALCVNLLACIIWKQWPELAGRIQKRVPWTDKLLNLILAVTLLVMCGVAIIFTKDASKTGTQVKAPVRKGRDRSVLPETGPLIELRKVSDRTPLTSSPATGTPNRLTELIRRQQTEYVGDSKGRWAHENFTDVELGIFKEEEKAEQIVESLKDDQEFLAAVTAIRSLPSAEREEWLKQGALTYHRTWTELGLDPMIHSREDLRGGQTEAGQEAERLIANGIVGLVRSLL